MSAPENPIARWSRLKRKAQQEEAPAPPDQDPASSVGEDATAATSGEDASSAPAFDLASLPAIETITQGVDVGAFLQSGVPAELARAALRRAWVSEPGIRDFIGIAENQWDFNNPTSIPGFGPLLATDDVPRLLAQALGRLEDASDSIAGLSGPAERVASSTANTDRSDAAANIEPQPNSLAEPPPRTEIVDPQQTDTQPARRDVASVEKHQPDYRPRHGGALPR